MIWKTRILYYLKDNPLGLFLALVHWGSLLSCLGIIPFDSQYPDFEVSPVFIFFIIFIVLDSPVIVILSILLIPVVWLFGNDGYLTSFLYVFPIPVSFYWFYVGKKISNFFGKDEMEETN